MSRPVKYETPEEMQASIDEYFHSIDEHNKEAIKKGHLSLLKPYTVTGLALALNLTRKGLIEYSEKNDEFGNTIKEAKTKVELFNEEQLYRTGQVTGVIFNLKNNFDWRDAQDMNLGGQENNPVEFKNMGDDELDARILELSAKTGESRIAESSEGEKTKKSPQ